MTFFSEFFFLPNGLSKLQNYSIHGRSENVLGETINSVLIFVNN